MLEATRNQKRANMTDHPKILVQREVLALTRLHSVTLWRLEAKNLFPRRIKLGEKKVGWLDAEVSAWLAARMAERFEARPVE
jgi:prophage regulatory protein